MQKHIHTSQVIGRMIYLLTEEALHYDTVFELFFSLQKYTQTLRQDRIFY